MVLAQDSRVYRRSSLEVAADAAERVARELRRVAVWHASHAKREAQFVAPRVDAYRHRAHAPPEDAPARLQSDALRMQRFL
jgi:hypothetical protein